MAKAKVESSAVTQSTLAVLVERVDTLTRRIDEKHTEIKNDLREIRDGSAAKIQENTNHIQQIEMHKLEKNEFEKYITTNDALVKGLIEYKTTVRGFLLALGIGSPIATAIITAFILKWANAN